MLNEIGVFTREDIIRYGPVKIYSYPEDQWLSGQYAVGLCSPGGDNEFTLEQPS